MAIQIGRKMVVILAGRGNTMTGRAIINDAGMIEYRSNKGTGIMTDPAILVCGYMVARFTCGERAIMAGATVIHYADVIKDCGYEASGLVT